MSTLRDIVAYIEPRGLVPYRVLKPRFYGNLTGLKIALKNGLLMIEGSGYRITDLGRGFLQSPTLSTPERKVCAQCGEELPATAFWKHGATGDGLFACCVECEKGKKRETMDRKKLAVANLLKAGTQVAECAQLWDRAVHDLASAWKGIMAADVILRTHRNELHLPESGRLEARLTFTRAAFSLHLALNEAGFPQQVPLLREVGLPTRLSEYIGPAPHLDYLPEPTKATKAHAHGAAA